MNNKCEMCGKEFGFGDRAYHIQVECQCFGGPCPGISRAEKMYCPDCEASRFAQIFKILNLTAKESYDLMEYIDKLKKSHKYFGRFQK